jgi:hypothetical protein
MRYRFCFMCILSYAWLEAQIGGAPSEVQIPKAQDAIKRGVQHNLGAIGASQAARLARAERLAVIAKLLPDLIGSVGESVQQINLAAQDFRIMVPIPGFQFPDGCGAVQLFRRTGESHRKS